MMENFVRDLRYAVRAMARMRGVAVVAILTLALGIGATTTMFSVVYALLLRPPPFADPDRIVILFNTSVTPRDGLQRLRWSMANSAELERVATSFESVGSFTGPLLTLSVSSKFTLNYGLRLEHEDGLREINNRQTVAFDQNATNPIDTLVPKAGTFSNRRFGCCTLGRRAAPKERIERGMEARGAGCGSGQRLRTLHADEGPWCGCGSGQRDSAKRRRAGRLGSW